MLQSPQKPTPVSLSVCMTIYNRADLLDRTLDAFARQNYPRESWELVIVDDSSTDHIAEVLQRQSVHMQITHVIMSKEKSLTPVFGNCPALGINLALRHASGDIIYKTDPEVLPVTPTLRQAFDRYHPERMVFGRVYDVTEGAQQMIEDSAMAPLTELDELVGYSRKWPYYFIGIFSRALACRIGGIDERFMAGIAGEDDDFAIRMQYAGATWEWDMKMIGLHQYHGEPWYRKPGRGMNSEPHLRNVQLVQDSLAKIGEPAYPYSPKPKVYDRPSVEERIERVRANKSYDWGSSQSVVAVHHYG